MMPGGTRPLRVAIVADLHSERWPSMDLVADMLLAHLTPITGEGALEVELVRPSMPDRGTNVGRFVNRFWDYPRWLKAQAGSFDVFHVVDHSYAHVVHALPANRTVVTCHDIDAFLPIVAPELATTRLPKALTRRVLSGMQKAARVTCDSTATFNEARHYNLLPADRMTIVPVGTGAGFTKDEAPEADAAISARIGSRTADTVDVLHVGSCIPRKRIDLLLRAFAAIHQGEPRARLLKAGGTFTPAQRALIVELGIEPCVTQLPFLDPPELAALYRRADVLLLPSEREGFGLPMVEALGCGTPVIATDMPVFREVGGPAALYAPLGVVTEWLDAFRQLREESPAEREHRLQEGLVQAARFSWQSFAEDVTQIYRDISNGDHHANRHRRLDR